MDCIECKATNLDGNSFCGKCGAELGRTLDETVRKRGFRDRQATEMEITDSVASRLIKWGGWLTGIAALILASFGVALNIVYRDTRTALDAGKTQIQSAVKEGKENITTTVSDATRDIDAIRRNADDLGKQVSQLRSSFRDYKEVADEMEKLKKQFNGQTTDLTKLDLRIHSLETVPGPNDANQPSSFSLGRIGCGPTALAKGSVVAYCAQGSPPLLFQRTAEGDVRPVSAVSPVGFQDTSNATKANCSTANRGTFYVEKGSGNKADKPFLCARKPDDTYAWTQLMTGP